MNLSYQKRLAARIMKCGVSRVSVEPAKEIEEALTKDDVRALIQKGLIKKTPKTRSSRANIRMNIAQKRRGRRFGRGSKKGTKKSRNPPKKNWMITVRALRILLKELRDEKKIDNKAYKDLYGKIKGGYFRNKHHLINHIRDTGLLTKETKEAGK